MNVRKIWEDAKKELHGRISSVSFDLWVKPLKAESFDEGVFVLSAPTKSGKEQALKPRHFEHIEAVIKQTAPIVEQIQIIDAIEKEEAENKTAEPSSAPTKKISAKFNFNVNPKQTFDNFIVGKSNQVVCAASESVAKNPSKGINPLFIYGGTGLGKTHLLNSIVNYVMSHSPKTTIAFATSENFTNDFVNTMRAGKNYPIEEFRK